MEEQSRTNNNLLQQPRTTRISRGRRRDRQHRNDVFIISDHGPVGAASEHQQQHRQTPPPEYKWEDYEMPPSYDEALNLSATYSSPPQMATPASTINDDRSTAEEETNQVHQL